MEDQNTSVNNEEIAEPQNNPETSANSEVAEPIQDEKTNAYYADQRRKQELEQTKQKSQEYENHLQELATLSGYQTKEELIQAMNETKRQQELQKYEDAGIDPNKFNELVSNHPDIQYAREMRSKQESEAKFQQEANELFAEFPDLKAEDVQPEVWQLREQGKSLLDAFLRVNYKKQMQQKEQEVIAKITGRDEKQVLSSQDKPTDTKFTPSNMSLDDIQKISERVRRGERITF